MNLSLKRRAVFLSATISLCFCIKEKQGQDCDIYNCTEPEYSHETGLASLVPECLLGIQGAWPSAKEFPCMEAFFRDSPIFVLGEVLVFPIEQ